MRPSALISLVFVGSVLAGAGLAKAPETSLRPVARTGVSGAIAQPATGVEPVREQAEPEPVQSAEKRERKGLFRSLRPNRRSDRVGLLAGRKTRQLERGKVCGDRGLQGEAIGRVKGRINGCGVEDAVRLTSVGGVALTQPSVMDCGTAKALKTWVEKGLKPAVGQRGGGVAKIKVAAHYACRTRNNQMGKRISEHGKGRAIDISAFTLRNGSEISVLNDWGKGRNGKMLRQMHSRACGPFGTVLGPNADRFHRDHFHFDTARYRSGSYCK